MFGQLRAHRHHKRNFLICYRAPSQTILQMERISQQQLGKTRHRLPFETVDPEGPSTGLQMDLPPKPEPQPKPDYFTTMEVAAQSGGKGKDCGCLARY